jgi:PucR C-terminal helix-turn-helix domain/GGDEF-like domain
VRPAANPRQGIADETVRRIEQATGRLATQSVARMDDELLWFRRLPPDQRSWVTLVAQSGLQSFVEWLRHPDDVLRLTGDVFAAAPQALARSVSLQQTVELIRETISVAEANLVDIAGADEPAVREELLRFSREIAFAAARVYARAAEIRGSWDDRLEALVIDRLVSGVEVGDPLPSQLAALGWTPPANVTAVVGTAPDDPSSDVLVRVRALTRRLHLDAMAGVHGGRLVVVLGAGSDDAEPPLAVAARLLPVFGQGPVVVGPSASDLVHASAVMREALTGLRAAPAWPGAPRPVHTDDLLPERVLLGDASARRRLVETAYLPLVGAGPVLVHTLSAFLDSGGSLEAAARTLFVHANTVRYRLRQVAEVAGEVPTDARGAFVLRMALTLGRLDDHALRPPTG